MLALEDLSSFEAAKDAGTVCNEADVGAFTFDVGFTKGNREITFG